MPPKKKNFFDKLSTGQKVTLIAGVLGGCCVILAAFIGLSVPLISFVLDKSARQSELATPTFLAPTEAVALPANQSDILSVVINPAWGGKYYGGLITKDVDPHKTPEIKITKDDVVLVGDISPLIDSAITFDVLLTGKATDEEVQVSNKIPIRVNYKPISKTTNLLLYGRPGGGGYYSMLGVTVNSKSKEVWAEYSSDILAQYQAYLWTQNNCPECPKIPSSIEKALSSNQTNLPDFFLVKNKEKIAIPVVVLFDEPGIYTIQFGIEYIYRQYKDISWTESKIQVYVPKDSYEWSCDNYGWENPESTCKIEPKCTQNSDGTVDCEFMP
jgi:hypothetical protein